MGQLRDSSVIIAGVLLIALGLIFQMIDSIIGWEHWDTSPIGGNFGTLLQLAGTLSMSVGVVTLVIGSLKLVRKLEPPPTKS